jgi:hypothetical protein
MATYAGALFSEFSSIEIGTKAPDFPPFTDTMSLLLAISHATYLGSKVVSPTKTAPAQHNG